jgi:hypothetical protein
VPDPPDVNSEIGVPTVPVIVAFDTEKAAWSAVVAAMNVKYFGALVADW